MCPRGLVAGVLALAALIHCSAALNIWNYTNCGKARRTPIYNPDTAFLPTYPPIDSVTGFTGSPEPLNPGFERPGYFPGGDDSFAPLSEGESQPKKTQKIVNGQAGERFLFPWLAYIKKTGFNFNMINSTFLCGATLINEFMVVTTANCVYNRSKNTIAVVVGAFNLRSTRGRGIQMHVRSIVVHPNFTKNQSRSTLKRDDIALLVLKNRVNITDDTVPICRPFDNQNPVVYDHKPIVISGWGLADKDGGFVPSRVNYATLNTLERSECQTWYYANPHIVALVDDKVICARITFVTRTSPPRTACSGDFGGPMTYATSGTNYLVGVMAIADCGVSNLGLPLIGTRVTAYLDWLDGQGSLYFTPGTGGPLPADPS